METLEDLKTIRDNAPDSLATDFTLRFGRVKYYKFSPHGCWYYFEGNDWIPIERPQRSTRSLSDIKARIELMELLEDVRALGFLEESHNSGVSHRKVCRRAKELLDD